MRQGGNGRSVFDNHRESEGQKGRKGTQRDAKGRKGTQRDAKGRKGTQRGTSGKDVLSKKSIQKADDITLGPRSD